MNQLTLIELAVLNLIPQGTERRISINEVTSLIDLDKRSAYEVINSLRRKGVPVCASRSGDDKGYYLATTTEELREGIAPYKSQIADMKELVRVLEAVDLEGWREKLA